MCRSIKQLRDGNELATPLEVEAAALQFIRKISGYRQPSRKNAEAFEQAVREVSDSASRLLDSITAAA